MNIDSSRARSPQKLRDRFREETNRAVLQAAEQVFADDGLHGASMSKIAERAGVAVGTLYNHFKDREALFDALIDQRRADLLGKLDETRAALAGEPFKKQLEGFMVALFGHFDEHRAFLRIVLSSEYGGSHKCEEMPRALYQRIEALLKVGHREKVLRPDPQRQFGVVLLGAVRATFLREKYGVPALATPAAIEAIASFFLQGAGR
jgi:AcrR family transcriptional regulator